MAASQKPWDSVHRGRATTPRLKVSCGSVAATRTHQSTLDTLDAIHKNIQDFICEFYLCCIENDLASAI